MDSERIADIRQALVLDPYNYDLRLELINILFKIDAKHLDLGNELESFYQLYPLGKDIWIMWIDYQIKVDGDVFGTYKKCLGDCVSLNTWIDFASFILDSFRNNRPCCSTKEARDAFEYGLGSIGRLLSRKVHEFWKIYRSWEEEFGHSDFDPSNTQKVIEELYLRQLKSPNLAFESAISEYAAWKSQKLDKSDPLVVKVVQELETKYQDQIKETEVRIPLERSLETSDYDLCDFLSYIKWEKNKKSSSSNIFRVKSLYEYAIDYHSFDQQLWMDYVTFIVENIPKTADALSVLKRATRFISSCLFFWKAFLELSELQKVSLTDMQGSIFDRAPFYLSASLDDMIKFFMGWLGYIRRLNDLPRKTNTEDSLKAFILWSERCQKILDVYFTGKQDISMFPRLYHYVASICCLCGDFDTSRSIYENDILSKKGGYSRYASPWIHYIDIELNAGSSVEKCRSLFKRALSSCMIDQRDELCKQWTRMEEQRSTNVEDLLIARAAMKNITKDTMTLVENTEKVCTIFLSNISFKATQEELLRLLSDSLPVSISSTRLIVDDSGNSRGFAYVDIICKSGDELDSIISMDKKLFLHGRPIFISTAADPELDPKTICVTNIPSYYKQGDLYSLFSCFGSIERVFLLENGVSFITFSMESEANAALSLDGHNVGDSSSNDYLHVKIAKKSKKRSREPPTKKAEIRFVPSSVDKNLRQKRRLD